MDYIWKTIYDLREADDKAIWTAFQEKTIGTPMEAIKPTLIETINSDKELTEEMIQYIYGR